MLTKVRLRKPWGDRPAGAAVEVDAARAAKLEEMGIGSIEPPDNTITIPPGVYDAEGLKREWEKALTGPPRDKMVKAPPRRKGTGRR